MGNAHDFIDSHAHLDEDVFGDDLGPLLSRASDAGVKTILTIGTTASSSTAAVSIASRWPQVHAAVGIQPNHGSESTAEDWTRILELARAREVRAIGETGLDAYWDFTPMDVQRDLFERHVRLSQELDLPVVVHMRDCAEETVAILRAARQRGPLRGVMHSFTGDLPTARQCLELDLFISFAGMVTFKKSDSLRQTARHVPGDRILIETDSPYLTPHPHRGERPNEPGKLVHTARCLAQARDEPLKEFAARTTANARRLFGLQ
ncbi:MAG: TatD family hydrolase [Planctomycetota bacterium]